MQRLLTIILSCFVLTACNGDSLTPEQQVRNSLLAMEEAAQERSMSKFMNYVSDDYSDHQGNNKEAIKRLLQVIFLRNQNINIFTLIRSVEINDGIAAVELSAAMASRDVDLKQETNRLKADTQRFSIVLSSENNNETWLVQSMSWQPGW